MREKNKEVARRKLASQTLNDRTSENKCGDQDTLRMEEKNTNARSGPVQRENIGHGRGRMETKYGSKRLRWRNTENISHERGGDR